MKRRARNKVAQLPHDLRMIVANELIDGKRYQDIQVVLRDAGVGEAEMPRNSAFSAYMQGDEYREFRTARRDWQRNTQRKKLILAALEHEGGVETIADYAVVKAVEKLEDALENPEVSPEKLPGVARALLQLTQAMVAARTSRLPAPAATDGDGDGQAVDPADVMHEVRALLGLAT